MRNISDIQMVLTPIFNDYGILRAVLFGSVAKGTATEKSDLDLLVDSRLHGLRFVGFVEAVRQAAGMEVDILDVSHIEEDSVIDREIRATGVMIYEKFNGGFEKATMTKTLIIEKGQGPTKEQLKEIEEARKYPVVFDEDCEELSPAMMKAFKCAVVQRNRSKKA